MGFEDFSYSGDIPERPADYILGFTLFGFLVHRYRNSPTRFYSIGLPMLIAGCMMLHTFPMIRKYSDNPRALKPPSHESQSLIFSEDDIVTRARH
jgi:hypothetical protein